MWDVQNILLWQQKQLKKSITLVEDTQHNLPVTPKTHKRAYAFVISSPPISRKNQHDPVKQLVKEEMERFGYETTMHEAIMI